jgi:hypothetical protein
MSVPSVKITITGYEGLSVTAEIPYNDNCELNEHEYFMETISLLLQSADFSESTPE